MLEESIVKQDIMKYLSKLKEENHPIFFERREAGGFAYKKGIPDLYAVYNGIHIEIEVKASNGKTRPLQDKWKKRCQKINIPYICVSSIEDFEQFFENIIKKNNL